MIDDEKPSRAQSAWGAFDRTGVIFTPLMNRRYLRELARFRLLLTSGAHLPAERAQALAQWWETLDAIMSVHHRAMSEVFWTLLRSKGPEHDAVVTTMNTRYTLLGRSRSEARLNLTAALRAGEPPNTAQLSFIRFHEEMSATSSWEEREIVFRAGRLFTAAEWQQVESYVLAVQAAEGLLDHVLPWLCEGLSVDRAGQVLSALPPPMRETYLLTWLPAYQRFSALAWPRQQKS
ncbi:hypothetical protein [Streptomyces cyaneofuscatus]|uniref:hypothetical protein n=1 Tax=Streptomyces cyaneofuscatus TaxID=66883 RepID=UPI0033AAB56B